MQFLYLLRDMIFNAWQTGEDQNQLEAPGFGFVCYNNELHSDLCIVNKQVRIDANTSTIYISSPT